MSASLVRPLPWDRLDIVGDVHGEIDALRALLGRLGCDPSRARVERPLVFVGDLVDRGPDSVAVVELVQHLVEAGVAQVLLGNHELNLVNRSPKEGNGWCLGHEDFYWLDGQRLTFDSRRATPAEQDRIHAFLSSLPVALESSELRIVHAAWVADAVEEARRVPDLAGLRALGTWDESDLDLRDAPSDEALRDARVPVPFHAHLAERMLRKQNSRPAKVLTSGIERLIPAGTAPRYVGGQWRFLERDAWWERDADERPVVFGHYWRRRRGAAGIEGKPEPLERIEPEAWFGRNQHAFCVDYSVGRRYAARRRSVDTSRDHGLAALRWPERVLVFDDTDVPVPTRS
jgi:hypothetical protein